MTSRLIIVVLVCLSAVDFSYGDDSGCTGWDDLIEDMLFAPLKEQINQASSEFYSLPDLDSNLGWGLSIKSQKGKVGNLTSFDLVHLPNVPGNASLMCQSADNSNITLAINVGLEDLEVELEDFSAALPVLPTIGNTKTSLRNSGNALSISISLITDSNSDCTASINYIQIRELGETSVYFDHGVANSVYQFLINHLYNLIINLMIRFGAMDRLNATLEEQAKIIVSQQGKKICDIMNGGGL
ncbi:hypothetical protein GE061_010632 [Apolygus lucorum]|uniref:Lipid-binding serum glycoprotein N-terminal domain-containing protein n=1 Tax=Apolygus lucorum TaxID=248454 RepID=A0A6A4JAK9_APOLU|nr:hypothetical protein GE061_010632 [Apolygus lucorum]